MFSESKAKATDSRLVPAADGTLSKGHCRASLGLLPAGAAGGGQSRRLRAGQGARSVAAQPQGLAIAGPGGSGRVGGGARGAGKESARDPGLPSSNLKAQAEFSPPPAGSSRGQWAKEHWQGPPAARSRQASPEARRKRLGPGPGVLAGSGSGAQPGRAARPAGPPRSTVSVSLTLGVRVGDGARGRLGMGQEGTQKKRRTESRWCDDSGGVRRRQCEPSLSMAFSAFPARVPSETALIRPPGPHPPHSPYPPKSARMPVPAKLPADRAL